MLLTKGHGQPHNNDQRGIMINLPTLPLAVRSRTNKPPHGHSVRCNATDITTPFQRTELTKLTALGDLDALNVPVDGAALQPQFADANANGRDLAPEWMV